MDQWEPSELRPTVLDMRNRVDRILDVWDEQRAQLPEVLEKLSTARSAATSTDGLATATVDAAGVVTEVRFTREAAGSSPDELARSATEACRKAARLAQEQTRAIAGPITDAAAAMPEMPTGAPSLREPEKPYK